MAKTINKTTNKHAVNDIESLTAALAAAQQKLDKLRVSELQKNQKALTRAQSQWRKAKQAVSTANAKQQTANKKHKAKPTAATLKQLSNVDASLLKAKQHLELTTTQMSSLKTDCEVLKQAITRQKTIDQLVAASLKTKTTKAKKPTTVKKPKPAQPAPMVTKPVVTAVNVRKPKKIKPKQVAAAIEPLAETVEPTIERPRQTEIDLAVENPILTTATASTTHPEILADQTAEPDTTSNTQEIKEPRITAAPLPETFNLFDH